MANKMILIPVGSVALNGDHYDAIACDGKQYGTPDGVKAFPGKKRYIIEWDILDGFDPWQDENEENACDWTNPRAIRDFYTGEYLNVKDYDFYDWYGKLTDLSALTDPDNSDSPRWEDMI